MGCGCSPSRGWKGDASWKGVLSGQEAAVQLGRSRESVAVQVRHPRAPFRMGVGQGLEGPQPCPVEASLCSQDAGQHAGPCSGPVPTTVLSFIVEVLKSAFQMDSRPLETGFQKE